jgi:hypothetical protein
VKLETVQDSAAECITIVVFASTFSNKYSCKEEQLRNMHACAIKNSYWAHMSVSFCAAGRMEQENFKIKEGS